MAAMPAAMQTILVDKKARLPPNVQVANDEKLVFVDQVQRRFAFAGLTDAPAWKLPGNVKGVAIGNPFVLADRNTIGHIHDNFN